MSGVPCRGCGDIPQRGVPHAFHCQTFLAAVQAEAALISHGIDTAGISTCPICGHTWTVSPISDCMMPACGCFGLDSTSQNPYRPEETCGIVHAWSCTQKVKT